MLSDNLRNLRRSKGLSQDELAIKLNVVRQTVSKWEKGLSVPDRISAYRTIYSVKNNGQNRPLVSRTVPLSP